MVSAASRLHEREDGKLEGRRKHAATLIRPGRKAERKAWHRAFFDARVQRSARRLSRIRGTRSILIIILKLAPSAFYVAHCTFFCANPSTMPARVTYVAASVAQLAD